MRHFVTNLLNRSAICGDYILQKFDYFNAAGICLLYLCF